MEFYSFWGLKVVCCRHVRTKPGSFSLLKAYLSFLSLPTTQYPPLYFRYLLPFLPPMLLSFMLTITSSLVFTPLSKDSPFADQSRPVTLPHDSLSNIWSTQYEKKQMLPSGLALYHEYARLQFKISQLPSSSNSMVLEHDFVFFFSFSKKEIFSEE